MISRPPTSGTQRHQQPPTKRASRSTTDGSESQPIISRGRHPSPGQSQSGTTTVSARTARTSAMPAAGLRSATWRQAGMVTGSTTFTCALTSRKTWSGRAESDTSLTLLSKIWSPLSPPHREHSGFAHLIVRRAPCPHCDATLSHARATFQRRIGTSRLSGLAKRAAMDALYSHRYETGPGVEGQWGHL